MITILFIGFVAVMAALVITLSWRYLNRKSAILVAAVLVTWLVYVGLLGYFGVIRNATMRPPGVVFILIPVILFLSAFIARFRSESVGRLALAIPLWIVLGTQSFRVLVELFIHQLWLNGLVPKMLTFAGANVDIYIGASAPIIAWLATRGKTGLKLALIWNFLGLCALINVVIRALLTAPGSLNLIHAEVPNRMFGAFPFMFIPGFFVPLAVVLHVLALRTIYGRLTNHPNKISINPI
jgi:hypothetical protein